MKLFLKIITLVILLANSIFLWYYVINIYINMNNKNSGSEVSKVTVETAQVSTSTPKMSQFIDEHLVVGKIIIEKINLETYIFSETKEETLNLGVAKFYGTELNKLGNFCIAGHNYNNKTMFGDLKKLKVGDTFILKDLYGQKKLYKIYNIYKVNPKDIDCLNYENDGECEVTLITCTKGALKRLIIKAVEEYD